MCNLQSRAQQWRPHLELHNLMRELGQSCGHSREQRSSSAPLASFLLALLPAVLEDMHDVQLVQRAEHLHSVSISPLLQGNP